MLLRKTLKGQLGLNCCVNFLICPVKVIVALM